MTRPPSTMFLVLCTASLGSGCLYSGFAQDGGPTQTQGLSVALAGQRCSYAPAGSRRHQTRGELHLFMRLTVRNDSTQSVTLDPQHLRVVGPAPPSEAQISGQSRTIAPARTEALSVTFRQFGPGCDVPMTLSLDGFAIVGGRAVSFQPLTFVADAYSSTPAPTEATSLAPPSSEGAASAY